MPLYEFKCSECGHHFDIFRPVDQRNDHGGCPECGQANCTRFYRPLNVIGDIEPYQSTLTGEVIGSRSKHNKHLREHGCVEVGTENLDTALKQVKKKSVDRKEVKRAVIDAYNRAEAKS